MNKIKNADSAASSGPGDRDIIWELGAHEEWISHSRKITLIMVSAIVVFASVYDGNLTRAAVRIFVFLLAAGFMFYKSKALFGITIRVRRDGQISIKKWPLTRVVQRAASGHIPIRKSGMNWLIGDNLVRLPVKAFPDLDQRIGEIPT